MLPGPVFEFELLTTARRGRLYAVRAGFAGLILLILWQVHAAWIEETGGELSPRLAARFAFQTFLAVAAAQLALILILVPALVAGVIADEKRRKTLHYLMASRLDGLEIVVGKLLARMLHVAVFLAVGLPIMFLLHLLGGVDLRLILGAFGLCAGTAFFLGALAVLVSVHARRGAARPWR